MCVVLALHRTRMKYADLPKEKLPHLVKPENLSLEDWQVMLRMQQASRENFEVECVSERYNPGEYRVLSPKTQNVYKVVYRGPKSPWNYCDCLDFKTSQLGTCKHIEAARQWITEHHKRIHRELPAYTSVYLSYRGNERRVKIRIGTTAQQAYRELAKKYFDDLDFILPSAYDQFGSFLFEAKALDANFRCYRDALDFILEQRERQTRTRIINKEYGAERVNGLLKEPLYPYQVEGVLFAAAAGRSIIADEMGLGKTVQAIAAAELLMKEQFVGQVLILCPTTLKYQWKKEIERFTNSTVKVIDGTVEERMQQMQADVAYKIASYNTMHQMVKEQETLHFDMVIMDEVHRLKNWNSQISRSVRKIESRYALFLTGTPLENRLEELYSIVEIADQFILAPYYQFKDRYMEMDETGRLLGYKHLNEIRERMKPLLLRRLKTEVQVQLPERIDKQLVVPVTHQQMEKHQELRIHVARLVAKWHRQHYLSEIDKKQLLLTLNQMRMVCDSLFLLDEHSRCDTKLEELLNILEECAPEKVVVFSQWERMTQLVAQELEQAGIPYVYINGKVPAQERQEQVDKFSNDESIRVFLSTDVGSVGLNLQAAQVLVNMDMPWNPAVLEQRIGRIHRIGQQHSVEVINLITKGTIEEDMLTRLQFKSSLFEGALDGGEDAVFMGAEKMGNLLESLDSWAEEVIEELPSIEEEEPAQHEEAVQTMLDFKEEPSKESAPADELQQFIAAFSRMLQADEETRAKCVKMLQQLTQQMKMVVLVVCGALLLKSAPVTAHALEGDSVRQELSYQNLVRNAYRAMSVDSLTLAEAYFVKALEVAPQANGNVVIWGHLAQLAERQGKLQQALQNYQIALGLAPGNVEFLLQRASLYQKLNNPDAALSDYNEILDQDPNEQEALLMRAFMYQQRRLLKDARADYDKLLSVNPMHEEGLLGLAVLNEKDRRPKEAMELVNRVVDLYPTHAPGYALRAGMEDKKRQDEQALADYNEAIRLDSENASYYLARASFYQKRKKKTLAREDAQHAAKLGANENEIAGALGLK